MKREKTKKYFIKVLVVISIGIITYYLYQTYDKIEIENNASVNETKIERTYRRYGRDES